MKNFSLSNQLREWKAQRLDEKVVRLTAEVESKASSLQSLKIQLENEAIKFKTSSKQMQSEIAELKTSRDTTSKNLKQKDNEISDLKKRIVGIYEKNEKDRNKAKSLFRRMFKQDAKSTSPADQKALDAIL